MDIYEIKNIVLEYSSKLNNDDMSKIYGYIGKLEILNNIYYNENTISDDCTDIVPLLNENILFHPMLNIRPFIFPAIELIILLIICMFL